MAGSGICAGDLQEGTGAEFGESQAGGFGFLFGEGSAAQSTEEVVEEALAGGGIVEHVSDEGGLGGFLDEVLETRGGDRQAFEKERVDGGVATGELRGVQIPTLIESVFERVPDVGGMKVPGPVDDFRIAFA